MSKNLVIISSAIHTNNTPLSYTPTRSHFTHEQRFMQTLETISSIREKIPNAYIVLVEVTRLIPHYYDLLTQKVDYLYPAYHNESIYAVTEGPYKGLGEASSILSYLSSEHFIINKLSFDTISKISGRYKLASRFRFEKTNNSVLCRINYNCKDHYSNIHMSTMFYTVDIQIFDYFIKSLSETCAHEELNKGIALEHILPICLLKNNVVLSNKTPLFVEGEYGPWGGYVMH